MAHNIDGPLSSIYRLFVSRDSRTDQLFQKWQRYLPKLTREDWDPGVQQYLPLILARDRLVQMKLVHLIYYTPPEIVNNISFLVTRVLLKLS